MRFELLDGAVDIDLGSLDVGADALREQLREYAAGERRAFEVGVDFPDSFTGRVMEAMAAIPYGETRTYGELAAELDTAPRAVGGGCGRNPVPVVVPCHRVLRSDGGLGGYSAAGGVALKRRLLDHEAGGA
ncbi:MAG: methylated-DNA--[protein]-cysteine S-methyltransferase [Halobacteriales archaeon]|nr:methylated-DNA--[protein]-cysteine S-methyltransferase [Halobacteriales archaeon]